MYPKMAAWANYWTTYCNAGFGDAYFKARNTLEPLDNRSACAFRLLGAVAEVLTWTLVDNDSGD